jgi:hypothetical protein
VRGVAPKDYDRYLREYEKLFLDVLVPCVFENSKSISYTPSSTSNGWLSLDFSKSQPITQRYDNKTPGEVYGVTGAQLLVFPTPVELRANPQEQTTTTTTQALHLTTIHTPSAVSVTNSATTACHPDDHGGK